MRSSTVPCPPCRSSCCGPGFASRWPRRPRRGRGPRGSGPGSAQGLVAPGLLLWREASEGEVVNTRTNPAPTKDPACTSPIDAFAPHSRPQQLPWRRLGATEPPPAGLGVSAAATGLRYPPHPLTISVARSASAANQPPPRPDRGCMADAAVAYVCPRQPAARSVPPAFPPARAPRGKRCSHGLGLKRDPIERSQPIMRSEERGYIDRSEPPPVVRLLKFVIHSTVHTKTPIRRGTYHLCQRPPQAQSTSEEIDHQGCFSPPLSSIVTGPAAASESLVALRRLRSSGSPRPDNHLARWRRRCTTVASRSSLPWRMPRLRQRQGPRRNPTTTTTTPASATAAAGAVAVAAAPAASWPAGRCGR